MKKITNDIYEKHHSHNLIFNQHVIDKIGLVVEEISFKHGIKKFPCIIYSASMTNARLLARLDDYFIEELREFKNKISLRFTFKTKSRGQNITFTINSKVVYYEKYDSNRPDIYFLSVEFNNKPPIDLIEILGNYIDHQEKLQKRAIKRYTVEYNEEELNQKVENYFFFDGRAKRCIVTEISLFSAKILISGIPGEFKENHSSMLIMKTKHIQGLGEMMGYIGRVELINKKEGLYSVIIKFDQEVIPPVYKMWVVDCIDLIVNKKP